jgi:hypothetical protein
MTDNHDGLERTAELREVAGQLCAFARTEHNMADRVVPIHIEVVVGAFGASALNSKLVNIIKAALWHISLLI